MATGRTIVTDALLEIGVSALGDDTGDEVINFALRKLNRMWYSWLSELDMIYSITLKTHSWPASTESQTMGSAGDISTYRPIKIIRMQLRDSNTDYPINEVSYSQFENTVSRKATETGFPTIFALRKTYPLARIHIYPLLDSAKTIRIQHKCQPTVVTQGDAESTTFTLTGTVTLPEGYEQALVSNLAVEMAPTQGRTAKPELIRAAMKSKAALVNINEYCEEMWPNSNVPGIYTRKTYVEYGS